MPTNKREFSSENYVPIWEPHSPTVANVEEKELSDHLTLANHEA